MPIDFNIVLQTIPESIPVSLTAVVPWAGTALMNTNWKGMPQLYAAREDVLEWT